MSCTSCGIPPSMEMYQNFDQQPAHQPTNQPPQPMPKCPSKEMQQKCLYTAQGMFMCESDQSKHLPSNEEMARNVEKGVAKTAHPWLMS